MRARNRFVCPLVLICGCAVDRVEPGDTAVTAAEASTSTGDGDGDGDGETETGTETGTSTGDGDGDEPLECSCAPGTDLIYVVSKFGEIWTYDPPSNSFAEVGQTTCGSGLVYSMAVDHENHGWLVDLDTRDLIRIDLDNPLSCTEPAWVPGNQGFSYPGVGFVSNDALEVCEKLYMLNYSGDGAFSEGPGIGRLGVYDPADGSIELLAMVDYDGGEIDGTGDGRLFAFAGDHPAKLVEYDRETGAVIEVIPLDGFEKTNASAFAFHSGDFYFFTESLPDGCLDCFEACTPLYAECLADPDCAESFYCALDAGEITDDCGGLMPMELANCMSNTCLDTCFPIGGKPSQVTRLDYDESGGQGKVLEVVNPSAPIRVVGAGTSICAPLAVP